MKKLTMYMVTHKQTDFVPKGRTPIFVGGGNPPAGYITDRTGDNISSKNKNYCELTAVYWIWKNDAQSDYVSIEHYRRFFMSERSLSVAKSEKISAYLDEYDAVASRFYTVVPTIRKRYYKGHYGCDLEAAEKSIKNHFPEYIDTFNKVVDGDQASMFNMIALSKENFDKYCEWLFTILSGVEAEVDLTERDSYQQRAYGFLSERLMNVWIAQNKLNVKRVPIYYHDDNRIIAALKSLKKRKNHVKSQLTGGK